MRNDNVARWLVLTMLRSPHEENGVGEIQHKVCETSEDNTKNGLGEDFWNILAQDFIIGLSCRMLVAKHAYVCQCHQGVMTKSSNSKCKCSKP